MIEMPTDWLILAQDKTAETVEKVAETAAETAANTEGGNGLIILAVLFLVFVLPFVLGTLIARALKLKDLSGRISVVLFTLVFGLSPFVWQLSQGHPMKDALRFGIDLAGGTNMVFQVIETEDKKINNQVMSQMVTAVAKRINPSGTEEVTVRKVGANRLEVIIPGADPDVVAQKKRQMTQLGSLEFAVLANSVMHQDVIRRAQGSRKTVLYPDGGIEASWLPSAVDSAGLEKETSTYGSVVTRPLEVNGEVQKDIEGKDRIEYLVVFEKQKRRVTGKYLTRVNATISSSGSPAVAFQFNSRGANLFGELTGKYQPQKDGFKSRLAVLLNEEIHSAPSVNAVIRASGIIEGQFTRAEIDELIEVLNAGALVVPIRPDPISEFTISPTLGNDVQEKGRIAILIAVTSVVIFMLVYYLFSGIVADLCLLLNLILVMGTMALIKATFTLPGLAGIVLTIGMAVDANVLIFERIREEKNRGSSLRMSIQNGFSRAFTTIIDANLTTLIIAVVLYMIGTDQVRGFAVTLFIGIVMSMFTALYFGRLIFDICERKRWITDLKMLSIIGHTEWNFLSKRMIAAFVSAVLIIAGMGTLINRGQDNLDIDFSGGTMVTFEFSELQVTSDVRKTLSESEAFGSAITIDKISLSTEEDVENKGKRFILRTKEQNTDKVRDSLGETLSNAGMELIKITMDYSDLKSIPVPEQKEDEKTPVVAGQFAGGNSAEITFSSEVSVETVTSHLIDQLMTIKAENGLKYEEPANLLEPQGLSGSGMESTEGQVKRFGKVKILAASEISSEDFKSSLENMKKVMADEPTFEGVSSFASSVATEMQQSAVLAMLISLVAIVAYIWFRFQQITFGLAAVVALVHDVLVVLGIVAMASYFSGSGFGNALLLYDFKINLPMIAAFMTIVGYSLNDTIVVFDRIREVRGKNPALTEEMINKSLNQTLARTILTSLTTFLVVGILYAIGGEGIHGFAFCLVMGVIVGTYSSIYVASPVLLWLMNREGKKSAATS
jgi:SecD/SecF fusion protein